MTQRIAESELEAAKEVAALEMELLKKQVEMQKEIVQKRLAAERAAAAAESLSLPASSICSGRTSRTVSVAAVDSEPSSRSSRLKKCWSATIDCWELVVRSCGRLAKGVWQQD